MAQQEPTIPSILQELAQEYNGIVNERELFERVLAVRPSQAKDPYASIRDRLRWDNYKIGWIRLGGGQVIPLRTLQQDLRFRLIISATDLANGKIAKSRMWPFVQVLNHDLKLEDATGQPITIPSTHPSELLALAGWLGKQGFQPADSILVTITHTNPLTLRLEHEPAADFRADDVLAQERELVDLIAAHVARGRTTIYSATEAVLPAYARAPWRTGYPGRPWQDLIQADPRLRVVDDYSVAPSSFRRMIDLLIDADRTTEKWDSTAQMLLAEIQSFQIHLRESRSQDAARGVWDGNAPRASTARVIFDTQAGSSTVVFQEPVDMLRDYTIHIEERLDNGDYAEGDWADSLEMDDDEFDFDSDDALFTIDEIQNLPGFIEQNPNLIESAQKLMASLTPDEVDRLEHAASTEEVQNILASGFHRLLRVDPSMFATLVPYSPLEQATNGNGNGNGHELNGETLEDESWEVEELDDNEWDEDEWDEDEGEPTASEEALERSNELMEQFYQHLLAQGKSEATAASRTGDLWVYADFLANYYNRGLAEGDYATLDECMFFFYPRKVINGSQRGAREMCTSVKQFYAFLHMQMGADDAFAQAIWRRRDQAAHVVKLYEQIADDAPQTERLFAHLFAPYTA